MSHERRELAVKLEQAPAILLLGQDSLGLDTTHDPFLDEIQTKFGPAGAQPTSYQSLFQGTASSNGEAALAWMNTLSRSNCRPENGSKWWLVSHGVVCLPLPIDTVVPRAFRLDWREVYPVYHVRRRPSDSRSRSVLHFTFLFGCVDQSEPTEYPPMSRRDLNNRRPIAVQLAQRIPELVSPFGTLVIEGYACGRDWLRPEELVSVIDALQKKQTHIFSVGPEIETNEDLSALVDEGKLILHHESLAQFLFETANDGYITIGPGPLGVSSDRRVLINEKVVEVPLDLWNRVRRTCLVLDESALVEPVTMSAERTYQEFRRFLLESSIRPVWPGYARNFAFRRDYEQTLRRVVNSRLEASDLQNEPIILHGASGTGKTVALGALCYEVGKQRKHPVLFIERRSQRPLYADIDSYCKWAEDNGASSTLIVWDGMVEPYQYNEMLGYLTGRGRKVVLVGASYRVQSAADSSTRKSFVLADPELSKQEIRNLRDFLRQIEPELGKSLDRLMEDHFLVYLYRLLPNSRTSIRQGLDREVAHIEEVMKQRTSEEIAVPGTALGYALYKAGYIDIGESLAQRHHVGDEQYSIIQEIVGLIMVPGRFGLKVPLDLLMRTLQRDWLDNMERIMDVDLFRMEEDEHGNITFVPRHPVEAKLICQVRFGTASQEVKFADRLLSNIRDDEAEETDEVQFAVDLVRSMGPNGQDPQRFSSSFLELSEILTRLRKDRSICIPRLMLQEATLIREYVVSQSKNGSPPPDAEELLHRAEDTLRESLKLLDNDRRSHKLRGVINVELGATLGALARHLRDTHIEASNLLEIYGESRRHLFQARALSPEDYHPLDIMGWMAQDLLDNDDLSKSQRAEITADILYLFTESSPEDFDGEQRAKFNQRKMRLADAIGVAEFGDAAFEDLVASGSTAGYLLRALSIVGEVPRDQGFSLEVQDRLHRAANYLEGVREKIDGDGRCLSLLLRCWWGWHVHRPLFFGERQTIPFSHNEWNYLIALLTSSMQTDEGFDNPNLKYLLGIALFHTEQVEKATNLFYDLERDSENIYRRRRILRSYLASTANGEPRVFHGTVSWIDNDRNRGAVSVNELRRQFQFIPTDFRNDLERGAPIVEGFHIAFNFISPILDPIRFYKAHAK